MKDKIKTFEDACAAQNIDPNQLPEVSMLPEKHRKAIIAFYKLTIIAQALNAGWIPDWSNPDEFKYYAWYWMNEAGSGFSRAYYHYSRTAADVGSRLCFKTKELALYAAEQFKDLNADYLLLN